LVGWQQDESHLDDMLLRFYNLYNASELNNEKLL